MIIEIISKEEWSSIMNYSNKENFELPSGLRQMSNVLDGFYYNRVVDKIYVKCDYDGFEHLVNKILKDFDKDNDGAYAYVTTISRKLKLELI
jgi:hypothetical protein